jgi:hypothetical protein
MSGEVIDMRTRFPPLWRIRKSDADCQRRRIAPPDSDRTRSISADRPASPSVALRILGMEAIQGAPTSHRRPHNCFSPKRSRLGDQIRIRLRGRWPIPDCRSAKQPGCPPVETPPQGGWVRGQHRPATDLLGHSGNGKQTASEVPRNVAQYQTGGSGSVSGRASWGRDRRSWASKRHRRCLRPARF